MAAPTATFHAMRFPVGCIGDLGSKWVDGPLCSFGREFGTSQNRTICVPDASRWKGCRYKRDHHL
jgi:hypothetical protein